MNDKQLNEIVDALWGVNPHHMPEVFYTGDPDKEEAWRQGVRQALKKAEEQQRQDDIWNAAMAAALKSQNRFTRKTYL